jgi:hypothetical protein
MVSIRREPNSATRSAQSERQRSRLTFAAPRIDETGATQTVTHDLTE